MDAIDVGLLVLRIVVGAVMIYHGARKLFGWWGGEGLSGERAALEGLGYRPPMLMAVLAALFEFVGGVLLAVGLFTPIAVGLLIATFVVVLILHLQIMLDPKAEGRNVSLILFEESAILLAALACLAFTGPGALSIDGVAGIDLRAVAQALTGLDLTFLWGAAVVVAGAVGGLIVGMSRRRA